MDVPGAVHGDAGWECEFCICSRSPVPRKVICAVSRDGCDRASRGYLANATAVDVCDIQIASTVHSHAPRSIECRTIRRSSVPGKTEAGASCDCADDTAGSNLPDAVIAIVGNVEIPVQTHRHSLWITKFCSRNASTIA